MKDLFSGYYPPSESEFSVLWGEGTFILDTNVILNLYRYPDEARDDLFRILETIKERLWIPYQVALEYQENRLSVISSQMKKYDELEHIVKDAVAHLKSRISAFQREHKYFKVNADPLFSAIKQAQDTFSKQLKQQKQSQVAISDDDRIRKQVETLFKGRIGSAFSNSELGEILKKANERYQMGKPPGYMDAGKKHAYTYGDLSFSAGFGDLVLWKQMLKHLSEANVKFAAFVTDDDKEDWWWIHDNKPFGPRPELVDEARRSGLDLFYVYNSSTFIRESRRRLGITIKDKTIRQVQDIAQEQDEITLINPGIYKNSAVEKSVLSWLCGMYPSDSLTYPVYPDSLVGGYADVIDIIRQDRIAGISAGYEIRFTNDPEDFIQMLSQSNIWTNLQILRREFSALQIILVANNEDNAKQFVSRFRSSMAVYAYEYISIVIGYVSHKIENPRNLEFIPIANPIPYK